MGFLTARRTIARLAPQLYPPPPGVRERPDLIVLPGNTGGSSKATVRIFIGTEAGQHRAERVFVWSIEAVRDRSRRYEIYLMKDLIGYDRRAWLTGFTNYRFLIPHLAGCSGRAIYNDVDQIYLADPAELFDTNLDGHGFLAITDRDTSVMLIDCERMARIWTAEMVSTMRRKAIEGAARAVSAWGPLDRAWNSRDEEYVAGRSKVLHYTTIHTQPWQPFPEQYVYQHNRVGHVWHELERGADAAGFQVFTLARPAALFAERMARLREAASRLQAGGAQTHAGTDVGSDVASLLDRCNASTVLELGLKGACTATIADRQAAAGRTVDVVVHDPFTAEQTLDSKRFDAVVSTGFLDLVSDEDVPWVLAELFQRATSLVYLGVGIDRRTDALAAAAGVARSNRDSAWWLAQIEIAAARHPDVHWRLWVDDEHGGKRAVHDGGRRPLRDAPPTTWVIADHKAGHTTQSIGLAHALGWSYEIKELGWNPLQLVADRVLGPLAPVGRSRARALRPPWPDLVIGTGWRTPPILRWIAKQSGHNTRTVQMGRKGGGVASHFDLVVSCAHFRFFPHPHRVEILAPVTQVTRERLDFAAARWPDLFGGAPHPRVVLLVGGSSPQYRLDADVAKKMGARLAAAARKIGGSVFAVTSPRTGEQAASELQKALDGVGRVHRWRAGATDNPYLAYLAGADAIVVTGESESMLAEAVATRKPVYIYEVPKRPQGPFQLAAEWITKRAYRRNRKVKGTIRPQQGLEYVCARLIERGFVLPPRDMSVLHRRLFECGAARPFADTLVLAAPVVLDQTAAVVERIKTLIGYRETQPAFVVPSSAATPDRGAAAGA